MKKLTLLLMLGTLVVNSYAQTNYQALVDQVYVRYKFEHKGKVADYIPALAKYNPNLYAIALVTVDGKLYQAGDANALFPLESLAKVFALSLALQQHGTAVVLAKLGSDATGLPFNSVLAVEQQRNHSGNALDTDKAPLSVANFVEYVKSGHYNGKIFHRVINDFMIQGGGMDQEMRETQTREPIPNEAANGLKNAKYTIAMARTMQPHSATAQFFINVKDNDFLNFSAENTQGWGYAVFGKVIEGTEVVDKIQTVATARKGMHDDVPVEAIVIETATIAE